MTIGEMTRLQHQLKNKNTRLRDDDSLSKNSMYMCMDLDLKIQLEMFHKERYTCCHVPDPNTSL